MPDSQDQFDLDVPGPLAEAIRGAYAHRPHVPVRVDDAIASAARQKFAARGRLKLWVRWSAGIASAAAAAVVAVILWVGSGGGGAPATPMAAAPARGDVDRSGRVDIVDAMVLAKHLGAGDTSEAGWDVNGDAVVNEQDVDALAAAAVNLRQRGIAGGRLPSIDQLGLAQLPAAPNLAASDGQFVLSHGEREGRQ